MASSKQRSNPLNNLGFVTNENLDWLICPGWHSDYCSKLRRCECQSQFTRFNKGTSRKIDEEIL